MVSRELIFKTLLYFDIFDFSPTKEEIWQFLEFKTDNKIFAKLLSQFISFKSFYFLKNRKKIVLKRIANKWVNELKIKKAKNFARKIAFIPSVQFVGISGSLAMGNSDPSDDIDFFIISSKNLIWLTRLLCISIFILHGVYRRKHDRENKNKICLNFLIDIDRITFSQKKQNIYLAHEIVQTFPLVSKDDIYKKFIDSNKWVYKYLPNASDRIKNYKYFSYANNSMDKFFILFFKILRFERAAKLLQLWYMKKDITTEQISDDFLAFHPINYEKKTLSILNQRI